MCARGVEPTFALESTSERTPVLDTTLGDPTLVADRAPVAYPAPVAEPAITIASRGVKISTVLLGSSFSSNNASGLMYSAVPGAALRKNIKWRSLGQPVNEVVLL